MYVARHIMTANPTTVSPDSHLEDVIELLVKLSWSGVPVVDDDGQLVGVISELALFDVLFDPALKSACVRDHMSRTVYTVDELDPLGHVAHMFALYGIRRLPVMSGDRVTGLISRRDLLKFALANDVSLTAGFSDLVPPTDEPDNDGAELERLLMDVHPETARV